MHCIRLSTVLLLSRQYTHLIQGFYSSALLSKEELYRQLNLSAERLVIVLRHTNRSCMLRGWLLSLYVYLGRPQIVELSVAGLE